MRTPSQILFAVDALQVETPGIYWPSYLLIGGAYRKVTHCNGYAQAILACLGLKIPTLTANDLVIWFQSPPSRVAGWNAIESVGSLSPIEVARQRAELGFPTIALWDSGSPEESGHIAVLVPAPDDSVGATFVTAAGGQCFARTRIENSFGRDKLAALKFYTHD